MIVKNALKITDSFTKTSKMPGLSYSLPAWACQTGAKLRKIPTSPCFGCYAMKNNYTRYPAIKAAQYRRLDAITKPLWVEAMVAQIKRQKWFRWHDAGDLQSVEHMQKVDGNPGNAWSQSSTVVTDGAPSCMAPTQGGKCLDCRACWNKDIKNVSYGKH